MKNLGLTILTVSSASLLMAAKPVSKGEDKLQPIDVQHDTVMYPLPDIALPNIPAGKFTETEESPALDLSRQWMRLAEAAKLEHSTVTQQLHGAWQDALKKNGP